MYPGNIILMERKKGRAILNQTQPYFDSSTCELKYGSILKLFVILTS